MVAKNRIYNLFVIVIFFLSGAVALVYEILWQRYLSELIGSSSLTEVVVLMTFLGGLAIGALLAGWLVDRWNNGLTMYGLLEIGIGLYAIFFPVLYKQANEIYISVGSNLEFGSLSMFLCKFAVSSLLILLPSIAMGGTLPVITRYLGNSQKCVKHNISVLYGLNTLGGVLGVLVGGFFLVHRYGLANSMLFAGVINMALGGMALIVVQLSRKRGLADDGVNSAGQSSEKFQDYKIYPPHAVKRAVFAAGVGGFAAMAIQVAWIRYFSVVLGATHSAFTIVVAAFIFGLGLGALVVRSKKLNSIPLTTTLALAFVLTSATVGIGLFFYARVPFEMQRLEVIIPHTASLWPLHEIMKFGFCFVLMLLPTMFSGMMLPVCIRIVSRGHEDVGRGTGKIYAINTIGGLLGILITSQLFFRVFSLAESLEVIFYIYATTSLFLIYILREKGRKRMLVLTSLVLLVNVFFWHHWSSLQLFLSTVNFNQTPPLSYSKFTAFINKFQAEVVDLNGSVAHVAVYDTGIGKGKIRTLFVNGKADASVSHRQFASDMEPQVMIAHIPMLLHATPGKVFVLGLGSGVTSSEVLNFPEVKQVVTAELVPEVFEASKLFAEFNHRFWENPRHRMVIEDGRTFMKLAEDNFDVIIAQPTNIWQNGMARLYSEDFFRLAKSKLEPGGVFAQWIHLYKLDNVTLDIVLKTFSQVFPKASCFYASSSDIVLIGYDQQWQFEPQQLTRRFNYPQVIAGELKSDTVNPLALLLREIIGRENFYKYTTALKSPINTDDLPMLEKTAEYGHYIGSPLTTLAQLDSRLDPDSEDLLINDYFSASDIAPSILQELIVSNPRTLNERLRLSVGLKLIDCLWNNHQTKPDPATIAANLDKQLGAIAVHPNYRKSPEQMTAKEAYNTLSAELLVWKKAASQLWAPDEMRLHKLYDRFAAEVDQKVAAKVARDVGLVLARSRICKAAQPFLLIAEEKGGLRPTAMSRDEISDVNACGVKNKELDKVRYAMSLNMTYQTTPTYLEGEK